MNDFTNIVSKVMEVRPDEGDYTGEDGCTAASAIRRRKPILKMVTSPCSDVTGIPQTAPVSKNAMRNSGWLIGSASMRTP